MSTKEKQEGILRQLTGEVVSTKMDKTIVVSVERLVWHKTYKKQYKQSKKFKVHDEKNEANVGNVVLFSECKPISKEKRWKLVKILKERK